MADKEYEINIKTTSDTEGITSVKEVLTETKDEAQEVSSAMEDVNASVSDIDSSSIDNLNESTQETVASSEEASSSTDQLAVSITSIDPSVIDQLRDSMNEYSASAQEGANSTDSLMEGLVSGGIATGLSSTFMGLADSAGQYNDSMLRMGLALEGHAMTVDEVSNKYGASVSKMADATGRGAGSVRNHFTNMAIAGVHSSETLESSFQAVANGSFYSGQSVEQVSNMFQKMSMTGMVSGKQLFSLGLSMEDLASVMGVSAEEVSGKFKEMTSEQRASILATASANKYGTEVNDVFKNSWEGLWTQLDKAKGGFERLVGELLLPYLIPAVQTASAVIKGLSDVFKAMPQPVKDVLGGILLLMGGITTLGLGLNAVMRIGKLVISPFTSLAKLLGIKNVDSAKKLATTLKSNLVNGFSTVKRNVTSLATSLRTKLVTGFKSVSNFLKTSLIPSLKSAGRSMLTLGKNALISGYNALKSGAMWLINKARVLATSIANGIATASQWALNIAMSMNPIGLLVIAIVGLIAVLGYLYFNNEQVRTAIDGLGQTLMMIGQIIYSAVISAWNNFITTITNAWNSIVGFGQMLISTVISVVNFVITNLLQGLIFFATLPARIGAILLNVITKAISFGSRIASNFLSAGSRAVSNFISYISQIPAKLGTELSNALNKVSEWASTLPQKFWDAGVNAVKSFLDALGIHSPGTMQRMLVWEINEMSRRTPIESKSLYGNISKMGEGIVDAFGEPKLQIGMGIDKFANASIDENVGSQGIQNLYLTVEVGTVDNEDRVKEIVDAVTRELSWNNITAGRTI